MERLFAGVHELADGVMGVFQMLSATGRIVPVSTRFVYPRLLQRSLAEVVSDRPQFDPIV
ncbi:unnamed protein product [Brugia pahangi]|nr:unnamed protein product [Brugia pahangi]